MSSSTSLPTDAVADLPHYSDRILTSHKIDGGLQNNECNHEGLTLHPIPHGAILEEAKRQAAIAAMASIEWRGNGEDDNLNLALVSPAAAANSNVVERLITSSLDDGGIDVARHNSTTTAVTSTAAMTAEFVSMGGEGTSLLSSPSLPTDAVANLPHYSD